MPGFKKFNPGCATRPCCTPPPTCFGVVRFQAYGCGANVLTGAGKLPNATVTLTGPAGSGFFKQGQTDANGIVQFNINVAGTYTYSATAAGFTTLTGSIAATCGPVAPGPVVGQNLLFTNDSQHTCNTCCTPWPLPLAGTCHVGAYSCALTFDGADLTGSFFVPGTGTFVGCPGHGLGPYPIEIVINFGITGAGTPQCGLTAAAKQGPSFTQICGPSGWAGQSVTCHPFSMSFGLYGCDPPAFTVCHQTAFFDNCECTLGILLGATSTARVFFSITDP
jgi:hypothetical protein